MSQFYASINGTAKTTATRQGNRDTGISGHVRGWNGGIEVSGCAVHSTNTERYVVSSTSGSSGNRPDTYLLTVNQDGIVSDVSDMLVTYVLNKYGRA